MGRRAFPQRRRVAAAVGLVIAVGALHWLVGTSLADALIGWGQAKAMPQRMQAAFVRELLPAAPPVATAAAPPVAVARPRRAVQASPAAVAPREPELPASQPEAAPEAEAAASEPLVDEAAQAVSEPQSTAEATAASAALASADTPPSAASAPDTAASAPAFDWPASTRLSYQLVGNYRGEVRGSARVEWVRSGDHYQVHLDVLAGLSFAPLFTRRMTSDGVITPAGLSPRRYDEDTKRAFADPRHVTMIFDGDQIVFGNGQRRLSLPGVQDTASQFIQLIWLFTTRPGLLQVGRTIEMPLALPRSVDRWVFDVLAAETLYTPFGPLESFHLKPRRQAQAGSDLTVEIWFVPSLQYLPARIRIHQDASTFIDLMLERPPLQAAPDVAPAPPP